jgi:hypothetical protein
MTDDNKDSIIKESSNDLCNAIDKFINPAEIDSVKYFSDGKKLLSRIYVSKSLYNLEQTGEFIKIPQTKVTTSIIFSEINMNSSLLSYLKIDSTNNTNYDQIQNSNQSYIESYKIGGSHLGYETIYYKIGNILLTFNYHAPFFEYTSFYDGFEKSINKLVNNISKTKMHDINFINESFFIDSFNLEKLRLNWDELQKSFNQISFSFYPFSYQYQYYTMNIDIKSVFDPGSDYKLKYGREIYRGNNQWYRSLYEVSSDQQGILISNNRVDPFSNSSGLNSFPMEADPFSNSSGLNSFPIEVDLGLLH